MFAFNLACAAFILTMLAAVSTYAATQRDHDDCTQEADYDRSIRGCTQIIDDTAEPVQKRALAYSNRAVS
jgi:hypothetical protein